MTKRYEYKYAIEGLALETILDTVKFHPEGFREAFPMRQVNNYYLDTLDLNLFYQNIDGISQRRKFRYRWYDDYELSKPCILEIKYKENELGWKENFKLKLADIASQSSLCYHFTQLQLTEGELLAQLYNSYKRYYFESFDKKYRITIDFDQNFGQPFHAQKPFVITHKDPTIILELKFDEIHFDDLDTITRSLPFLRTKNSKYSNGITKLHLS